MKVAFQGERGAYSEMACYKYFPSAETVPCKEFDHAFDAVENGTVDAAVIPIDNSTMGGVYRVYELLLERNLPIIGETFVPITHCLLSKGTDLSKIKRAYSHPQALGQCKAFLDQHGIEAVPAYDTAGAAKQMTSADEAAIASRISATLYNLNILKEDIATFAHNTTRFFVLTKNLKPTRKPTKFSLIFKAAHRPGALYHCLGCFAKNNVNLTKIESRPIPAEKWDYLFYIDCEGNLTGTAVKRALEELKEHTTLIKLLGEYNTVP